MSNAWSATLVSPFGAPIWRQTIHAAAWRTALTLAVALLALLGSQWVRPADGAASTAANGAATEPLPAAAQTLVSSTLGRDDPAYHVTRSAPGGNAASLRAQNAPHGLVADFARGGVSIAVGAERLGLGLAGMGRGTSLGPVPAARLEADANRITYERGLLIESYDNGPMGLEQAFTVRERPGAGKAGELTIAVQVSGSFRPAIEAGGRSISLLGGTETLRYGGLFSIDAAGRTLPSSMSVRDSRILIQVDDRGAIYPVTIDPFVKKATLSAAGGATGDSAGVSVGISGDTIVVGADKVVTGPGATGSAYVFVKPAGGWATSTAPAKLTASDKAADDAFGSSVAISGSTIVVAAVTDDIGPAADRGSAYVFTKPAGGWATGTQTAKLTASDGAAGDKFGSSVAVDGDTVVVGAYYDATGSTTAHGSGYVFVKPAGAWVNTTQTAKLTASDEATNWQVGRSAGISGNTIALGAHGATVGSTIHAGALYVYVKPVGGWANATEVARLTSATPLENAFNGWSIGISGDTVVGGEINIASVASTVHVYVKPSGGWVDATETAKLSASDGHASDYVGISVAISGATIVAGSSIGAAAYVFVKPAGGWVDANETQKLTVTPAADGFGASVGIVGDAIVVGAPGADIATATSNEGGAFVFERPSATTRKPDGRIRLGTSGAYIGDNIYNATGASQSKTGSAKANRTITFQLSIQNDGAGSSDAFKLKATGAATSKFTVKYLKGSTDITAAVVAGTYTTAALAPGATVTITAKVTVKASSAVGNSVTRLVTITSVGDGTKKDAVKLVGKRS